MADNNKFKGCIIKAWAAQWVSWSSIAPAVVVVIVAHKYNNR